MLASDNDNPISSDITVAPVKTAKSCNISLRLSPKPGAFTAAIFNAPLMRLTTNVPNASPSKSSAIIKRPCPD